MKFGIGGSETLSVRGRKSGAARRIPVIPVEVDNVRYIVSARGESEWVRNLRAAGSLELQHKGVGTTYTATEIPVEQRSPIVDAYRQKAGRTVTTYWQKLPNPEDHPVSRPDNAS
jgi:deazaflavin-dependent oxidoreductase (nitroreductase family)